MIDFTLSIDLSGGKDPDGYFAIDVLSLAPFTESPIDDSIITRKSWGEVKIKNLSYPYYKLGGDKYKLYDILLAQKPTQEIHLKFVSSYETIYGYFGKVDCDIDDDQEVITIKTYTLDQYTDLLENRETEVKLFDEGNIIVNGNFLNASGNSNEGYTFDNWQSLSDSLFYSLFLEKKYLNDKSGIAISTPTNTPIHSLYIAQYRYDVLKGKQMSLSFFYALMGGGLDRVDLSFDLFLLDPNNSGYSYRLKKDGSWTESLPDSTITDPIVYADNVLPYDFESMKWLSYPRNTTTLTIDPAPATSTIEFRIYRCPYIANQQLKLFVTDIKLSASAIKLNTVTVEFLNGNLVTKPLSEMSWKGKAANETHLKYIDSDQDINISNWFDSFGKPLVAGINVATQNKMTLGDLLKVYSEDTTHECYKFELSKITVFKGEKYQVFLGMSRRYHAIVEFSREEQYFEYRLYTEQDYLNGLCKIDEVANPSHPVPPEENQDWFYTGRPDKNNSTLKLWVRTPFKGAIDTWSLEDKKTGSLRSYNQWFNYTDSQTSTKQYPVQADSTLNFSNAIDFREIITQTYNKTHPSLIGKKVYSNFIWNDPLSETEKELVYLGNSEKCNYVTMTADPNDDENPNILNKILAIHTYEFIPSESRTPADTDKSILKLTFKKLMDDLLIIFPQCYWFIDEAGDLHIEHIKYFDRVNTAKNLLTGQYAYLHDYSSWTYDKGKMYSREEYSATNSGYLDFAKTIVTFDKITGNKRGEDVKATYTTQVISTDVQYCAENPTSLNNGIVLVVYNTENGVNKVRYGTGQNSGKSVINGELSLATLIKNYATYEGTWEEGLINDKGNNSNGKQTFYNTIRCRNGKEIWLKGIVLDKVVLTKLGVGLVKSRNIDYNTGITKITAVYRHDDHFLGFGDNELTDMGGGNVTTPELPTIGYRQAPIDNITQTTATLNGNVSDDGGATVSARGFVYATTPNPTLSTGTVLSGGTGTGFYSVSLTGLTAGTNYFIREFATNSKGTSYGTGYAFKTSASDPVVTTDSVVTLSNTSVQVNCTVVQTNDSYSLRGICYSTNHTPTVSDLTVFAGVGGEGTYSANIDGLIFGQTYYVRAYISDFYNFIYGEEIAFNTEWEEN